MSIALEHVSKSFGSVRVVNDVSLRNLIPAEVTHDLYHFKRRGVPLRDCITRLDSRLDPDERGSKPPVHGGRS